MRSLGAFVSLWLILSAVIQTKLHPLVSRHHANRYRRGKKKVPFAMVLQPCADGKQVCLCVCGAADNIDMPTNVVCSLNLAGSAAGRSQDIIHVVKILAAV